ncbi:unnamed protein product [Prorocentrum cordatum]|uniref:Uncharacterized protein n=1 Tax=Prorocentrum cordatum TaxID=2364126 RepID=A0ABN9XXW7_9DINO|nr:unnamed protein product [Polarella glacialis]
MILRSSRSGGPWPMLRPRWLPAVEVVDVCRACGRRGWSGSRCSSSPGTGTDAALRLRCSLRTGRTLPATEEDRPLSTAPGLARWIPAPTPEGLGDSSEVSKVDSASLVDAVPLVWPPTAPLPTSSTRGPSGAVGASAACRPGVPPQGRASESLRPSLFSSRKSWRVTRGPGGGRSPWGLRTAPGPRVPEPGAAAPRPPGGAPAAERPRASLGAEGCLGAGGALGASAHAVAGLGRGSCSPSQLSGRRGPGILSCRSGAL